MKKAQSSKLKAESEGYGNLQAESGKWDHFPTHYPMLCAWCAAERIRTRVGWSTVENSSGICKRHAEEMMSLGVCGVLELTPETLNSKNSIDSDTGLNP